jgi:2-polyprenyl-3-methyl-5-hydroxy-6-metoxy-1,4-benzoquinol methylase
MTDQDSEGILSPLLRNIRVAIALPYLRGRILDVGCGSGQLAAHLSPERYLGVDINGSSLMRAKAQFPYHQFMQPPLPSHELFDTLVLLAVIEHVNCVTSFLRNWRNHLVPNGRMVVTTPHPQSVLIHRLGAAFRLFSRRAAAEHKCLFDRAEIASAAHDASLRIKHFHKFEWGLNQLVVLERL